MTHESWLFLPVDRITIGLALDHIVLRSKTELFAGQGHSGLVGEDLSLVVQLIKV